MFRIGPWTVVAAAILATVTVNATSVMIEAHGRPRFAWWEPVVWEGSSAVIIAALAPLVGWAVRRWPPRACGVAKFVFVHMALTVPFALVHVGAVAVIRGAVYALVGKPYAFFEDGVPMRLVYEWRKDVLVYAAISLAYWWFETRRFNPAPAAVDREERIEIRNGSGAVFLAPSEILTVEAAGNYVEFRTAARTHLVRGALSAWQERLGALGFVRVHRSRLVNRARIVAIKSTPAGDVEITLDTGLSIAGSRRYRAALGEASA